MKHGHQHLESARAGKRATQRVRTYLSQSLAENTIQAYASDLRHFKAWGGRIPASPDMVARYLADCAGTLKATTLVRRLAAIAHAHHAIGSRSPVRAEIVRQTLRGILRVHGTASRQAKPISLEHMKALVRPRPDVLPLRDLRDRTLILLGFAGGFRRSELVELRPTDVQLTREGALILVRRSKTDQTGKGRLVAIPRKRGRLCPIKALMRWMLMLCRLEPEAAGKPLFRRIDRYGGLHGALRAPSVGVILKERLRHALHNCEGYSAHSLRAGLVTSAAAAGVPTWAIQRQTGHRSERSVHRYVRGLDQFAQNAFGQLLQ